MIKTKKFRPMLKHSEHFSRLQLAIVILSFAAVGAIVLLVSFAAPNPNHPGDLNNDNTVNALDLSLLLGNYGTTNTTADINGDGKVSILDLSILLSHYGQNVTASCNLYASPTGSDFNNGSITSPFRSAYQLSRSLRAGQTGCLRQGSYPAPSGSTAAWFTTAGTSTSPITLTSYPGERGTITGIVKLYAPFVNINHIDIDGSSVHDATVWVQAFDDTVADNSITNKSLGTQCMNIGANESWGNPAGRDLITRNYIYDCGLPADGNQDHAIYFENSDSSHVIDNVFWGAQQYVIHLYPNSQNNLIEHNVIANNNAAVIFAGDLSYTSNNNVVRYNLITDTSSQKTAIRSCWSSCGAAIGSGNTAYNNCLFRNLAGDFENPIVGWTSTNNLHADPLYINATAHDFRMGAGSACLSTVQYDTAAKLPFPVP